jgi:hypothetical protein
MCEPIHHDGRGYCLTKSWSSSGDWIEIHTDDAPDSPTSPINWVSLPAEVAPKVAAVIVRRYLREHPISDE